ncbi:hypothetical protein [Halobaculum sp. EA56]|uniref:hypothetical protein n=1 Tax=Halobaculum sp. EA56 TaxID=3421648 RepID=UPI003EBD331B
MTDRRVHVASAVPAAFLAVAVGHHPAVAVPLVAGVLLPEVDTVSERFHRSWVLHTPLVPALAYAVADRVGVLSPPVAAAVHFLALGMTLHLLADFVYPREMSHEGAAWPVRPTVGSTPWGLLLLGVAWAAQWFLYLAPSFLPWLVGYGG